jgi:hypothetical protein
LHDWSDDGPFRQLRLTLVYGPYFPLLNNR